MAAERRAIPMVLIVGSMVLASAACGGRPQETGSAATADGAAIPISPLPSHPPTLTGLPGNATPGELAWTLPKEWAEEPPKSGMRKAQYRLPAAPGDKEDGECVVYYFGAGQGGDVKPNLDRWATQFHGWGSTPPKFSEMKSGGFTISRAEIRGTYAASPMSMGGGPEPEPKAAYMLLGAIVPGPEANWFFKCTGPEKTMEANRARFDALLASVRAAR